MNLGLQEILCAALNVYYLILIARAILSFIPMFVPAWTPPAFLRPLVDLIFGLTEPPLQLLRRVIPQPMGFPLDISFMVLFFVMIFLRGIVC
ncbi:MAG: YggT family protein [Actinomycetota bacterium]